MRKSDLFQKGDLLMIRASSSVYTINPDAPLIIESIREIEKPQHAIFLGKYAKNAFGTKATEQYARNLVSVLIDGKEYAVDSRHCMFYDKENRSRYEKVS